MAEIDDVKLRVTQNEIDIDALQSKEDAQDLDIANFYTKIANTDSTVAALDLRFDNYDVQLDALSARINGNDIDIDAHDGRIWNLEIDVTDLQVRVNFLESQTLPEGVAPPSVIDNLTSIDATAALSANQGRVLKNKQDELVTDYNTLNTRVTTIEASVNGTSVSVVDNLTSVDTTAALSANQGRALKALTDALDIRVTNVETKATNNETNITDITTRVEGVETLSSQNSTDIAALQASDATNQVNITNNATAISNNSNEITVLEGRVLTLEEAADAEILVEDNLTSTSTTTALSANQGRVLKEGQDALDVRLTNEEAATATAVTDINDLQTRVTYIETAGGYVPISVIDELTSQESNAALSANQGRVLKEVQDQIVLDVDTLESRLTTEENNNAVFSADIQNLQDRLTIEENKTYVIDDLIDVNAGGAIGDNQVLTYDLNSDTWVPGYPTASLGITSFAYRYSTSNTATPGSGTINTNNTADPTAVTYVYVNAVDDTGTDVTLFLDEITEGDWINLYNKDDQSIEEAYDVAGTVVRVGNVYQIPVTYYTHSTTRLNNNGQIKLFWKKIVQIPEPTIVEDTLASTSTVNALSANQGKILNDKIDDITKLPVGTKIEVGKDVDLSAQGFIKLDSDKILQKSIYPELEKAFNAKGNITTAVVDYDFPYDESFEIDPNGAVLYKKASATLGYTDIVICEGWHSVTPEVTIPIASTDVKLIGRIRHPNPYDSALYIIYKHTSGFYDIMRITFNYNVSFAQMISSLQVSNQSLSNHPGTVNTSYTTITRNFFVCNNYAFNFVDNDQSTIISFDNTILLSTVEQSERVVMMNDYIHHRGTLYAIDPNTVNQTVSLGAYDYTQNHSTYSFEDTGDVYLSVRGGSTYIRVYKFPPDSVTNYEIVLDTTPTNTGNVQYFFSINDNFFFSYTALYNEVLYGALDNFLYNKEENSTISLAGLINGYDTANDNHVTFNYYYNGRSFDHHMNNSRFTLFNLGNSRKVITPVLDTSLFVVQYQAPQTEDSVVWVYSGVPGGINPL